MRSSFAFVAALSLATLAPLASGCATHEDDTSPGSLQLPLTRNAPDGSIYQLSAQFEIIGPGGTQIVDGSGFETELSVPLPPGLTTVRLLDGWTLTRTAANSSIPQPVSALLGTANPFILRVLANHATQVQFGFIVRDTSGDVDITFGVTTDPRELAGGVRISDATGEFAPYVADFPSRRLDFAFYFELNRFDSVTLPDGTKDRVYIAGLDEFNPTPVAGEFFNDLVGTLSGAVGPSLAGGYLEYHLSAKPDGTRQLTGTFTGGGEPFTTIDIGPYTLKAEVPLDADGFPADVFFHDDSVPFTLVTFFDTGESVMKGFLNLRHIP